MLKDAPLAAVVVVAALAVAGALIALFTWRLSSTVVAVLAVVVGSAGVGLATGGAPLAMLLLLGGVGLVVPVVAGVVVVDLDGRPPRTLRPWRLLILVPVVAAGVALLPLLDTMTAPAPASTSTDAVLLALLALAATGPAVLLLVRRREAA